MPASKPMLMLILATGAVLLASCSSGPPRQTTIDLTRAQTLVASAEGSGAQQYAAADLQAASAREQAQGIAAGRIQTIGRGENYPVASNATTAGRQQNRRVDIILSDTSGHFAQGATQAPVVR